jgi:predicted DNA-binding transcriptional regulator AlpA
MNAQLHQFGARMNPQQPKADMTQPERVDLEQALAAAATIPLPELPSFLGQLREIEATALARLHAIQDSRPTAEPDQLLDVTEAAKRLSVSKDYLYRNWKKLPFAQKYEWGVRFRGWRHRPIYPQRHDLVHCCPKQTGRFTVSRGDGRIFKRSRSPNPRNGESGSMSC